MIENRTEYCSKTDWSLMGTAAGLLCQRQAGIVSRSCRADAGSVFPVGRPSYSVPRIPLFQLFFLFRRSAIPAAGPLSLIWPLQKRTKKEMLPQADPLGDPSRGSIFHVLIFPVRG